MRATDIALRVTGPMARDCRHRVFLHWLAQTGYWGIQSGLIKLTLDGLIGPIEVLGESYPGQVPMTPFRNLLSDDEVAAVLTYVRNAFGNQASAITPAQVESVRVNTATRQGYYTADELLQNR